MSDKKIILSKDEAKEILEAIGTFRISYIYDKPLLMSAIVKLAGEGEQMYHPAMAGEDYPAGEPEMWRIAGNNKIELIKFVRTVTGWGLMESKNFVEQNGKCDNDSSAFVMKIRPSFIMLKAGTINDFKYKYNNVKFEKV